MADWRRGTKRAGQWTARAVLLAGRVLRKAVRFAGAAIVVALALIVLGNVAFYTRRDVPYRALDPRLPVCQEDASQGWDALARANPPDGYVSNDEWSALDKLGDVWRQRFACSIQRHRLSAPAVPGGEARPIVYDLAFVEFQEDGKPYASRLPCTGDMTGCIDEGYGPVRKGPGSQLGVLIEHLKKPGPHYLLVFIHGWRHDASIGDENVSNIRHYAAHAARFLADRAAADPSAPQPRVTAVFIGWRGARTDETWLKRKLGHVGSWIGTFSAVGTLFDRKPVSESIAPSVLAGLRALEDTLDIDEPLPQGAATPKANRNRMIVFGHSLGGNLLASALKDDVLKKVARHQPGDYLLPAIGDLVVLINPASEATKWTDLQRAVWTRLAIAKSERRPAEDYVVSHRFFRRDQRPVLVSVTAARDWPPGGRRETDCAIIGSASAAKIGQSRALVREPLYDWATYDLFPAFKGDFRPLADTLRRWAWRDDPHDACDESGANLSRKIVLSPFVALSAFLRVLPFQQTDPEQTRTIGNLDPPRAPRGRLQDYYLSARPFGTTHELRGASPPPSWRKPSETQPVREIPVDYDEIGTDRAACPPAPGWLTKARQVMVTNDPNSHGTYWTSEDAGTPAPALIFLHGFKMGGVGAITRANDPFWNMRAFDTALARHDGYMLSSFICAMNQLVMDDVTEFLAPVSSLQEPAPAAAAPPSAP